MSSTDPSTDSKIVKVRLQSVYGRPAIYPANDTARIFADLTGKRTFSPADIKAIEKLGFTVVEVPGVTLAAVRGA